MLDSFVRKLIRQGKGRDDVLSEAIRFSRLAFQKFINLENRLDQLFGSSEFRQESIEPVLRAERQLSSIEARAKRGGTVRNHDKSNLEDLMRRNRGKLKELEDSFPWEKLSLEEYNTVSQYMHERRTHLEFGDADAVKRAFEQALIGTALVS